jgi:hypothetical protein
MANPRGGGEAAPGSASRRLAGAGIQEAGRNSDAAGMMILTVVAALIAMVVGSGIGIRLVRLSGRTQGVPERLMGCAFVAMFLVGYPGAFASRAPGVVGTGLGTALFGLGLVGIIASIACFYTFTRRVFRPHSPWARKLLIGAALASGLTFAGTIHALWGVSSREAVIAALRPWAFSILLLIIVPFAWTSIESSLYYRAMRRRRAIGLADALTTNRFLLWALGSGMACALVIMLAAFRAAGIPILAPLPTLCMAIGTSGLISFWYFTFVPPHWYQRWLEQPGHAAA